MTETHYHVKSISLGGMCSEEGKNRTVVWEPEAQVHSEHPAHIRELCVLLTYAKHLRNVLGGHLAEKIKYCHHVPFKGWSNQF